jgi:FtsZ-interacting cell division protein YlmF
MSVIFRHHDLQELFDRPQRAPQEATRIRATGSLTMPSMGFSGVAVVRPTTYNEARSIGELFSEGRTVSMDLRDMDDSDALRLVDFVAGLIFGRHGTLERVENKVFILTPAAIPTEVDSGVRDRFLEAVDHMREDVTAPGQTGTGTRSGPTRSGRESASA